MPFNHSSEEALLADVLRALRAGELPFRDFVDIYGPVNWLLPFVAYSLGGGRWIAVRAWMIVVQLAVAVLGYQLLRRLGSRFHAWIAAALTVALFGMPWFLHYAPYAFMHVYPMTLGVLWWLLLRDAGNATRRSLGVGVLVALALLTKLSAGAFLLAGSLFVAFYLLPPVAAVHARAPGQAITSAQWRIFALRVAGLVAYAAVFTLFVLPHYELGYLLHLSLPLSILLVCTGLEEWNALRSWAPESYGEQLRERVRHCLLVLAACAGATGLGLLILWPLGMLWPMVEGLAAILGHVDYHTPFEAPIIGKPQYRFSQARWQQLPWLTSLVLLAAWLRERGAAAAGDPTARLVERHQLLGFFAVTALAHHVVYPTADLGHLLQSFVPWILLLALSLSRIEGGLVGKPLLGFRTAVGVAALAAILAIAELPLDLERYRWRLDEGAGLSQQASYLKLREDFPRLYDYGDFSSPRFQQDLHEVARFLKAHTGAGERVWVLTPYMSLYFFADLPLYGEHYRWLVYCMIHGRLTREGFVSIAGDDAAALLLDPPPRFIVDGPAWASEAVRGQLPELEALLTERYRPVISTESMKVYGLADG